MLVRARIPTVKEIPPAVQTKPPDSRRNGIVAPPGEYEGHGTYTDKMRAGEVFVSFVKVQDHAANFLTNSAYDPTSKIPEYKVCAVRIEKIDAPA